MADEPPRRALRSSHGRQTLGIVAPTSFAEMTNKGSFVMALISLRVDIKTGQDRVAAATALRVSLNGDELNGGGGIPNWGTDDAFFPISVPTSVWDATEWDCGGVDTPSARPKYDIAAIHKALINCKTDTEYRRQMKEVNLRYFDLIMNFDGAMHSRGAKNNPFWGYFRDDIAKMANKSGYLVVWPIPKNLAEKVWKQR